MNNDSSSAAQAGITLHEAQKVALAKIKNTFVDVEMVVEDDKTRERVFGWVFFYTTKKYLETRDVKFIMPGNAPLVVLRKDGKAEFLTTSLPPNVAIEEYETSWKQQNKQ